MPQIALELRLEQLEKIIGQLSLKDRLLLIQRLERKNWGQRFRALTSQIDQKRKKFPISQKEILKLCKQARQERYASRRS